MFDSSHHAQTGASKTEAEAASGPAYFGHLFIRFLRMAVLLTIIVLIGHWIFEGLLDLRAGQGTVVQFNQTPRIEKTKVAPDCYTVKDSPQLHECRLGFTEAAIAKSAPVLSEENEVIWHQRSKDEPSFRAIWTRIHEASEFRRWMRAWFSAMYVGFLAALFSFFMGEAIYRKAETDYRESDKPWKIPFVSKALNEKLTREVPRFFARLLPSQIGALFVGLGTLVAMVVFSVKERFDLDPKGWALAINPEKWNDNANVFRLIYDMTPWANTPDHQGYFYFLTALVVVAFISPVILGYLFVRNTLPNRFGLTTKKDGLDLRIEKVKAAIEVCVRKIAACKTSIIDAVQVHFPDFDFKDDHQLAVKTLKADISNLHEEIALHRGLLRSVNILASDISEKKRHLGFEVSRECAEATCPTGTFQAQAAAALAALVTCETELRDSEATLIDKIRCFQDELAKKQATEAECEQLGNELNQLEGEKKTLEAHCDALVEEKARREADKSPILIEQDRMMLKHARYEGEHDFETLEKDIKPVVMVDAGTMVAFLFSTLLLIIFGNMLLAPELHDALTYSKTSVEHQIQDLLVSRSFWAINAILIFSFFIATWIVYDCLPRFMAKTFGQRMTNFALFGFMATLFIWLVGVGAEVVRPYLGPALPGPDDRLEVPAPPAPPVALPPGPAKPLEIATLACKLAPAGKGSTAFVFNQPTLVPVMADPAQCQIPSVDASEYNYYIVVGMASEEGGESTKNKNLAAERATAMWKALDVQVSAKPIKVYWYNRGVHACSHESNGACATAFSPAATSDQRMLVVLRGYDPAIAKAAGAYGAQALDIASPASHKQVETTLNGLDLGTYSGGEEAISQAPPVATGAGSSEN